MLQFNSSPINHLPSNYLPINSSQLPVNSLPNILTYKKEYVKPNNFIKYLSIIDPYSLYLHKNISEKEDWWNKTHARKLYYYRDYIPQFYKE